MIKKCRSCENKKLIPILSLGNLYLSEFSTVVRKPKKFPLDLVLCTQCLLVQLKKTTPPSLLYTDSYGYKSGINNTMREELKSIVEKTIKIGNNFKKPICIDIGANDGTLLSFYPENYQTVAFEPITKLAKECKKYANTVINDFFNAKAFSKKLGGKKAQIITAISCFYDIDDPNSFLKDITNILDDNGIFVIQQNYLVTMLQYNAFDNIVHEHLEYYSLLSLETLLRRHNLEVFDVELSQINGGSFRTYISFSGKIKRTKRVKEMRSYEEKLQLHTKNPYLSFRKRVEKNREKLHSFIKKLNKEKKKIYVYGASTRGNTLLQYFHLDKSLIPFAVERNEEKWGKYISSVGIPIISEKEARINQPDYMLVLPWFFKEEFLYRERSYLENGGKFIFPLPKFEIVSKKDLKKK